LRETLHAGPLKIFAEASKLFAHAVFKLVVTKTAFPECSLEAAKMMEVGGC
jgi:hypothetical protein